MIKPLTASVWFRQRLAELPWQGSQGSMKPFVKEFDMKKRFLAFLLAVCIACSMLVVPANAAASNAAVQTAVTLGGLTSEQASALSTALTRGQLAKLLVAFSAYRESAATQGNTGTLFSDVDSGN